MKLSRTHRPHTRLARRGLRALLSTLLCTALITGVALQGSQVAQAAGGLGFLGTLGTSPNNAAKESAAGVKVAMMELSWKNYETSPGVFNAAYEKQMQGRFASLKAAGMQVTLGLGLHFTPTWVTSQPGSRMIDQNGKVSAEADLVFSNTLRQQAEKYLARANQALGFANFWSVRITSGGRGELLYPEGMTYWAFNTNAQNGPDMPSTMAKNPFPGWKPGTAGLTRDQVKLWAIWYVDGLVDVAKWQINTVRSYGFTGYVEILTPGTGVYASLLTQLASKNLPASYLGVGAFWSEVYKQLAPLPNVVANVSSMADGSAGNDKCTADDRNVALGSIATQKWGSTRWVSRIADEYGLKKVGENPQWRTGNNAFYTDKSSTGMMGVTMAQATACNFFGTYWAHDSRLWDGTVPFSQYAGYTTPSALSPARAATN